MPVNFVTALAVKSFDLPDKKRCPDNAEFDLVTVNDKPCWLYLDGNITNAPQLQRGDVVQVRRGEYTFATILLSGMNFYEAVRGRFNFLIRPNTIPSRSAKQ